MFFLIAFCMLPTRFWFPVFPEDSDFKIQSTLKDEPKQVLKVIMPQKNFYPQKKIDFLQDDKIPDVKIMNHRRAPSECTKRIHQIHQTSQILPFPFIKGVPVRNYHQRVQIVEPYYSIFEYVSKDSDEELLDPLLY